MSGFGKKDVVETNNNGGIVVQATIDYLECLGVKEYFKRCKELGIDFLNQTSRYYIAKMKQLTEKAEPAEYHPHYLTEMANCMEKTFNLRNQHIVHHSLSVRNAVAIYPGLRDFQEIRREFERISGKSVNAFERHLNCVLKHYAEDQICRKYYTCTSSYCTESLKILRRGETNNSQTTAARMIIFACAQSNKTWLNVIFKVFAEEEEKIIQRPHPTVLVHGSPFDENCADVYCEQIKIIGGVNFHEAVLTCYFLYYIFNINFPLVDFDTYQQFENVLNLMSSN